MQAAAPEHAPRHTSRARDSGPRRLLSPYEGVPVASAAQSAAMSVASTCALCDSSTRNSPMAMAADKGKGVSRPIPIQPSVMATEADDLFSMSPMDGFTFEDLMAAPSPAASPSTEHTDYFASLALPGPATPMVNIPIARAGKGKARALGPPVLPPLAFTPMEIKYGRVAWPSPGSPSIAGPSGAAYGAILASIVDAAPTTALVPSRPAPLRTRSLSSASVLSTRTLASRIRVKLGAPRHSNILSRKTRAAPAAPIAIPRAVDGLPPTTLAHVPRGSLDDLESGLPPSLVPSRSAILLKNAGRAYTSPYPLTSAVLEVVPPSSADLALPVPVSLFEERLPSEVKLLVMAKLVQLHEEAHAKTVREGAWTAITATASSNRWVGTDSGMRELIRLGQVSKSWMALTRDGQLWARLDLHAFPKLPAQTLFALAAASGSFATALNLRGHAALTSLTLQRAVDGLCMQPHAPGGGLPFTLLTDVRLRGCRAVSTRSLHALLTRAPALVALDVRGLSAVTNTTCDVLGVYCARLEVLDISRCTRVDAAGLHSLCVAARPLRLRELRAAGLRGVGPELMRALARAAPALEVLDLSGARTLDDVGVRAFVQCGADDACAKVQLSAREAGRDPADGARHWRRVTALRHLALSGCTALTDGAGAALAHAVPALELLELAGIGPALREPGLVRLVRTTPALRALDLEDASAVADDVLAALPTARLERVCVAYADATDAALAALVRTAPRLRVLEADNTHLSGATLAAFVHAARARGTRGAYCAAGDNRGVGEASVRALDTATRPRAGFRTWDAGVLSFIDGADGEGLGADECDDTRVVVKTFYSWQTVDAVAAVRRKRAKARRAESPPGGSRMRWWAPGGRRASTLASADPREAGEGCVVM